MPLHLELNEHIAAPVDRVYAALTDLDAAPEWMPNLVGIEKLTPNVVGKGMQWKETRRMFGREATEVFEVSGVEPNRSVDIYVDGTKGSSKRGWYRFRYELEPREGGTAVRMAGEFGGMGKIGEFIGRFMLGTMKKAMAKDLVAMKQYIETRR